MTVNRDFFPSFFSNVLNHSNLLLKKSWNVPYTACFTVLQINRHVLSGSNHNPMLVERVNRYLNKGLKIMTNERGLLVKEQRAYHRELVNSWRPDPTIYSVGDIVFARRAVRSNAAHGQVETLIPFHRSMENCVQITRRVI